MTFCAKPLKSCLFTQFWFIIKVVSGNILFWKSPFVSELRNKNESWPTANIQFKWSFTNDNKSLLLSEITACECDCVKLRQLHS